MGRVCPDLLQNLSLFPNSVLYRFRFLGVAANEEDCGDWHMVQVSSADECWLVQRSFDNFRMLDEQLHQCIFDRKISQLADLSSHPRPGEDVEVLTPFRLCRLKIKANVILC